MMCRDIAQRSGTLYSARDTEHNFRTPLFTIRPGKTLGHQRMAAVITLLFDKLRCLAVAMKV